MPERLATDGGTILELDLVLDEALAPIASSPKFVQLCYVEGEGFKYRKFGETDFHDIGGGTESPLTTKGDLYTFDTMNARLPVGANGKLLSADSAQATGLKWIDAPASSPLTTKGDLYGFTTG